MDRLKLLLQKFSQGDARTLAVKKNALYSIILKGISVLVSFSLVPLTIGYVSSEIYGVWLTLSSIVVWLGFLDIGFSQGLKNKLAEAIALEKWERGQSLVSTTYFLMAAIFVPVTIIAQFIIPLVDWCSLLNVPEIYREDILKSMHVLVAFCGMQQSVSVLVSVVAAYQKVALSSSFMVLGNAVSLGVIFILSNTCPPSLFTLCSAVAAIPVVILVIASVILYSRKFVKVRPSIKRIELGLSKELFGLGIKFFIINIQVLVLYQSTNVLISNISSSVWVAAYNVAYKYLNVAMMLYTIINAPLWPAYTDAYAKQDFEWMKNMKRKMQRVLLLAMACCVVMFAVSPWVYSIWVGNKIDIPLLLTAFVMVYVCVYCWMSLNCTLLVGMGKIKVETIVVVIGMVLHIPLSFIFGTYIGAYGVVLSMILINIVYAIVFSVQVRKILNRTAKGIWLE